MPPKIAYFCFYLAIHFFSVVSQCVLEIVHRMDNNLSISIVFGLWLWLSAEILLFILIPVFILSQNCNRFVDELRAVCFVIQFVCVYVSEYACYSFFIFLLFSILSNGVVSVSEFLWRLNDISSVDDNMFTFNTVNVFRFQAVSI